MPDASFDSAETLFLTIRRLMDRDRLTALGLGLLDYETGVRLGYQESRPFHSASTIKLAVLLAVFKALDEGRVRPDGRLHVRNRFLSRVDSVPYHLDLSRDGEPQLYQRIGRTESILHLAEQMIVRSSNLATNILIEFLGIDYISEVVAEAGFPTLRCVRGVEDELAFREGINNQVDVRGLLAFFELLLGDGGYLSDESRQRMREILLGQQFNAMIPAGLPKQAQARVAHKTGEISCVCHDAGVVFLPGRKPYILVVLTEFRAEERPFAARKQAVAEVSRAAYEFLERLRGCLAEGEAREAAA